MLLASLWAIQQKGSKVRTQFWWFGVGLIFLTGCFMRPAKPVAIEERIAPIYPEARPVDCSVHVLTSPPAQPYDVFAHIVSYGNEIDGLESMNALIRDKACEVGADAVVLLPPQQVAHMNIEDSFPDWVQQQKQGQFGRYAQSADRKFSLARRGFAVVFKRDGTTH